MSDLAWILLAVPAGAVGARRLAQHIEIAWLVMFGAGNLLYIVASDLIPEIKALARPGRVLLRFGTFALGLVLMGMLATMPDTH